MIAEELRIGNLVNVTVEVIKDNPETFIVEIKGLMPAIKEEGLIYGIYVNGEKIKGEANTQQLSGIELTAKKMLEFGLDQFADKGEYFRTVNMGYIDSWEFLNKGASFKVMDTSGNTIISDLKYVHIFQNLISSLTGKEIILQAK